MSVKITRIDDLTGRVIDGVNHVEIEVSIRRISVSGAGPAKARRFHSVNEKMLAMCHEAVPEPEVTTAMLEILRQLIRGELENART